APGTNHALPISNTRTAALQLGSEQLRASGLCIDAATLVSSCVDASWEPSQEITLKGQFAMDSLAELPISLEPWRIEGGVKGSIDVAGPLAAITGNVQVSADGLSVQRPSVDPLSEVEQTISVDTVELSGTWRAGALDVSADVRSSHAANLTAEIALASWLQADSQIDGRIQWQASDLATLDVLMPDIGIGAGRAHADISVTGTRRDPVVVVDGELVEGEFYIIPTNTVLRDVSVSMNGELLDSLDVRLMAATGEGSAAFDGSAGLGPVGPFVKGTLRATDATLADLEDTRLTASADIALGWHPHSLSVVGKARFDSSAIEIRSLPESAIRISPDAVIDAGVSKDALESVRFRHIDVTTTLGDGVRLSGFGLDTELTGKIRLKQFSDTAPAGFGRLELKNASYRAYGQSLSVTRGVLDFGGPLEAPYLSLRAERDIETGSVGIDITGSPDALESELFSEPDRTDAEKLSLLLTGRDLSNNSEDDGASLADAAITLGLRQAFGVSSAIRNGVGLDTLTLDGSGRDGRILAGKQLSERIYLQYAYGVFDQLSSVLLRFQINDRLALESVSGEDQAFDLLYEAGSGQ
ncbi:MAG: translocation/assembly module TamB domain-containing protein, partial [Pseudomonadota bacterium]